MGRQEQHGEREESCERDEEAHPDPFQGLVTTVIRRCSRSVSES
jgi:hypothetical protein